MSKIRYFIAFAVGAVIGTKAAWHYTKKKYKQIAQSEIDSVKAAFAKNRELQQYSDIIEQQRYDDCSASDDDREPKKEEEIENSNKPYVISPDDFGDHHDYDTISLTYYSDGVLADDDDRLIEDVENTVGTASLNSFGEYEDDSVFVCNELRKVDYEILLDQRKYSEVLEIKPYLLTEE